MKRIPTLALFTLAALIAIPGALAQGGLVLKANVPFGFTLANTSLPPGHYTISSPSSGIVRLWNSDKNVDAQVVTTHGYKDRGHESELVFERFGGEYFLRNVLCPRADAMNMDIPASKAEKRARTREAKLQRTGEEILVALR